MLWVWLVCMCVCFRGQVMNAEMMSNVVDVELIYEGIRYSLKVSRVQPTGINPILSIPMYLAPISSSPRPFQIH